MNTEYNSETFDSKDYLQRYYQTINGHQDENYDNYFIDQLLDVINHNEINGSSLLDVGSGPCMHTAIISSKRFSNIYLSDYLRSNREELTKWLKNDQSAHDWTSFLEYISKKESSSVEEISKRTKESVKGCIQIDVNLTNPLEPNWFNQFDCILTSLCLEAACPDFDSYNKAIENLSNLLKVNGCMIMMGVLGETFYRVADVKWGCLKLEINDIKQALIRNGHEVLFYNSQKLNNKESDTSDCNGLFIVLSKKK
ncbi:indolethylamine N-methyltransferase [Hydra vulgaris]|uniref:indolethylamine N-methyltransferase n=1 Tax=Hydra vulgaris TaxID=6087 RepID=UPI001F5E3C96|nr:indolethylamine N-methyltransferase-like [Hydra vulgaris]XP_047124966.1 indolethylamine N-methyltransferase-like [Hydra vulgaris]